MKGKEIAGWAALLSSFVAVVATTASFVITPPSELRGKDGRKFALFEHVFTANEIRAENRLALEESISKKLVQIAKEKKDSIASAERARNDSIKSAMATKKMKPRAQFQQKQQVRILQKH